jgi:thioredoxin reductase
MPKGMFLKSLDFATSVYTPRKGFSLIDYCRARGLSSEEPIPMELFSTYGLWAQEQLVSHLEQVSVSRLGQTGSIFDIELSDGQSLTAKHVVMAVGLTYFAFLPPSLARLPAELVSHTSKHREYADFSGRDVAVVGSGQSALEAAVMLHEAGARPQLITRRKNVYFAVHTKMERPLREKIKAPMTVLGPGRLNFVLEHLPFAAHYFPDAPRIRLTRTHLGPFGSWWLAPRFEQKVPVVGSTEVVSADPKGGKVLLRMRDVHDGTSRDQEFDHIVAGTGYEPDLSSIPFLDPKLTGRIERIERAPRLNAGFETSVPGLYFVGASSAFSFGPLMRFVCGAEYAAPTVSKHLVRRVGAADLTPRARPAPA